MWAVVHIAPNRAVADMIKEVLEKEGLLVMVRPLDIPHMGASGSYEVLVPEGEAPQAQEILAQIIGE
ncbi:MAG TPA: glutamate decarboxylase [Firmicutes bacterium]|nr:glutamate decarboxylase [Bacillota bacterium]